MLRIDKITPQSLQTTSYQIPRLLYTLYGRVHFITFVSRTTGFLDVAAYLCDILSTLGVDMDIKHCDIVASTTNLLVPNGKWWNEMRTTTWQEYQPGFYVHPFDSRSNTSQFDTEEFFDAVSEWMRLEMEMIAKHANKK